MNKLKYECQVSTLFGLYDEENYVPADETPDVYEHLEQLGLIAIIDGEFYLTEKGYMFIKDIMAKPIPD